MLDHYLHPSTCRDVFNYYKSEGCERPYFLTLQHIVQAGLITALLMILANIGLMLLTIKWSVRQSFQSFLLSFSRKERFLVLSVESSP